jgi:hypothetical protein
MRKVESYFTPKTVWVETKIGEPKHPCYHGPLIWAKPTLYESNVNICLDCGEIVPASTYDL